MLIEWSINKERGNLRPVLSYRAQLEEHEKALAVPEVTILSTIPRPDEHTQKFCYPGTLERSKNYSPTAFYTLETPSHRGHAELHTMTLPWREDNAYPEVEQSFAMLRDALEKEIRKANASVPMEEKGVVRTSREGKQCVAQSVAAARFLRLAKAAREA